MLNMEPQKPPPKASDTADRSQWIELGGPIDRVKVCLRFFGDSLIPEELTRLLGCQPTVALRKGEVIPNRRYHQVASIGSWRLNGAQPEAMELEEQVKVLLGLVTDDLEVWRELTTTYGVDIFCGLFLEESNRRFRLSADLVKMLSDRGIEMSFDVYGASSCPSCNGD